MVYIMQQFSTFWYSLTPQMGPTPKSKVISIPYCNMLDTPVNCLPTPRAVVLSHHTVGTTACSGFPPSVQKDCKIKNNNDSPPYLTYIIFLGGLKCATKQNWG